MADPHEAAPERAVDPTEPEDPLAADRRTLVIGAVSMVALILVGVVSAQLFARGGCRTVVAPEPATVEVTTDAPEDVIAEHLGTVDGARAVDIVEQVAGAPVVAAVPVGDADRVAELDGGLITTGGTVTSFDARLEPVATFTTDDRVVGDGTTVYDVNVPNPLSGQTDAFVALTGTGLDVGTCVDTALVGSPFAFLLDAGDDQLLLFRAEEDGDAPDLQLRDPDGAIWDVRLDLPSGPPGTLAERLDAQLGPDAVAAARRVGPQEETDASVLVVVDRLDGTVRFELDGGALADAGGLDPTEPIRWQVAAVGHTTVLVHGRPDPLDGPPTENGEPPTDGVLVLLDLDSGSVVSTVEGVGQLQRAATDAATREPGVGGDRYVVATTAASAGPDRIDLLAADGTTDTLGAPVSDARFAWAGEDLVVAARDSLTRIAWGEEAVNVAVLVGGRFADVTATEDGRIATLVTLRDGGDAVLLVTGPTDAPTTPTAAATTDG